MAQYFDYTVHVSVTESETPLRVGDTVTLQSTEVIVHPVGTSPTTTYEWEDHNGLVIGSSNPLVYIVPASGHYSAKVSIRYQDVAQSYDRTIVGITSFYVKGDTNSESSFTLGYKYDRVEDPYSNMDIHRYLSYMPKWSLSYKSFYSNFSKMMSPIMESISNSMSDLDNYIENNTNIDGINHFGYRKDDYKIVSLNTPLLIKTEHGICSYIGEHGQASIEAHPIKSIIKRTPTLFSRESFIIDKFSPSVSFSFESVLYIQEIAASLEESDNVTIIGMNASGEEIKESITLISPIHYETINKFKVVHKIISNNQIIISNYIDLSDSHSFENGLNLQKRITNTRGGYFHPLFDPTDNTILILNGNEGSRRDEYKMETKRSISSLFVNNLLDVIYLNNNTLYSTKLMLDYYSVTAPNSSTNNNSFIYISDENTPLGDSIEVVIDLDLIRGDLKSNSMRIELKNNGIVKYLDNTVSLVDSSDTWISLANKGNRISFSVPVSNYDPYIFSLSLDNRQQSFVAMNTINSANEFSVLDDVNDIFIYNKELWAEDTSGDFWILDHVRLGYTSSKNTIHLPNVFADIEVIYEQ